METSASDNVNVNEVRCFAQLQGSVLGYNLGERIIKKTMLAQN